MRKFLVLSFLFFSAFNLAFAQELVLSDRIREAREAARKEAAKVKLNSELKPVNEMLSNQKNIYEIAKQNNINLKTKDKIR